MKKKSVLLSFILIFILNLNAAAQYQQDYTKTLVTFFKANGSLELQRMTLVSNYTTIALNLLPYDKQDMASEYAQRYFDEQYINDMAEIVIPFYQKYVSLNDLNTLIDMYDTSAARTAVEHSKVIGNDIINGIASALKDYILNDGKVSVKPKDYPASYMEAFKVYYKYGNFKVTMENAIKAILGQLGTDQHASSLFMKFVDEEMITVYANICYPTLTETDILTLSAIDRTPQQANVAKASAELAEGLGSLSIDIVMKFSAWLSRQY